MSLIENSGEPGIPYFLNRSYLGFAPFRNWGDRSDALLGARILTHQGVTIWTPGKPKGNSAAA